jgi:hypothetical protein
MDVASPCVGICRLDKVSGLCVGCLRTGDEIALWPNATTIVKAAILTRIERRRRSSALVGDRGAGAP